MSKPATERETAEDVPGRIATRRLAAGDGWSLSELRCRAGPGDRPFEERHDGFSIAAVLSGHFTYRGERDAGLLVPGALLLGNSGRCFRCGHEHGVGDTCVSLNIRDDLFAEVAATSAGRGGYAFERASLPPSSELLPIVGRLEAATCRAAIGGVEEFVWLTVERVVAAAAGRPEARAAPSAKDARRIVDAIRRIEADPAGAHDLGRLSAGARMSRYHFLRVFRRVAGATPHQYLIQARMRRAANRLANSREPVLSIAFECGFGDLSTFNRRFREIFGVSPRRYRVRA